MVFSWGLILGVSLQTLSAAVFPVTTLADNGNNTTPTAGSLREAIKLANASAGPHTITFTVAGTITPITTDFPTIVRVVTIDGTTAPGWSANTNPITQANNANLTIQVRGPGAGYNLAGPLNCFRFGSGSAGSKVIGMCISDFANAVLTGSPPALLGGCGIRIDTTGCTVSGCFIGSDLTGTVSQPCYNAVRTGANSNIIGGTTNADRNLIAGNYSGTGSIRDGGSFTLIQGNTIGLNRSGTVALQRDARLGLFIGTGTQGSIVKGNVISGNSAANVQLRLTDAVLFQNNFVGTDVSGTTAVGPNGIGIILYDSPLDGPTTIKLDGNLISGNTYGIHVGEAKFSDFPYMGVQITNNLIGTNATQTAAIANQLDGIWVKFALNTYIAGNTIGGNGRDGIRAGKGRNSLIRNNMIGVNRALSTSLSNGRDGIRLGNPAPGLQSFGDVIGGARTGEGNVIANNFGCGIKTVSEVVEETIQGNTIVNNAHYGIHLGSSSERNTIGSFRGANEMRIFGDLASQGTFNLGPLGTSNIIAGNGRDGIKVHDSNLNVIQTNIIYSNHSDGIEVEDGSYNMIGGAFPGYTTDQPILGNIITDNGGYGVVVEERYGKAVDNTISTNQIGDNNKKGIELQNNQH